MLLPYMTLGGPLMWPLLACSVLLGGVLVERCYSVLLRHRLLGRRVRPQQLRHHRVSLPFFVEVPPSLGLLGTVLGVVKSFGLVEGRVDTQAMAAGLSVACMTTVFGLAIAIVATVARYGFDWLAGSEPEPDPATAPTATPNAEPQAAGGRVA